MAAQDSRSAKGLHLDRCAGDHLRSGVSQPDGEAGSDARSGTPAEFAAAIEEQRVKIAAST
jgi:hypothetical protein